MPKHKRMGQSLNHFSAKDESSRVPDVMETAVDDDMSKLPLDVQLQKIQQQYQELKSKYETALKENDKLLNRVSSLASSKLRDNNPSIADLSDPNRPTKLAEKISELYDNQWTDAYEELEGERIMSDREIVDKLLKTLMDIYVLCKKMATENFFERVQRCIEGAPGMNMDHPSKEELPQHFKQQVKEIRKLRAPKVLNEIEQVVRSEISYLQHAGPKFNEYISDCIKVCWLAVVQDPPLAFHVSTNKSFQKSLYKEYTERGPTCDFVVWPSIHLQENGPLLSKGIAQGCSKVTKEEADLTSQVKKLGLISDQATGWRQSPAREPPGRRSGKSNKTKKPYTVYPRKTADR